MRYGLKRNLTFAIGKKRGPDWARLGYPRKFKNRIAYNATKGLYNIICHHTRFDDTISSVVPNDTVYITILRNPVENFESLFYYDHYGAALGIQPKRGEKALDLFLDNPRKYYNNSAGKVSVSLKNPMLYDLGLEPKEMESMRTIQEKIKNIENTFNLVLLIEYFDESLVLMKHILNWDYDDLVYVSLNSRSSKSEIKPEIALKIWEWNSGDVMLYNHFNQTLWRRLSKIPKQKLDQELQLLRDRRKQWRDYCIYGTQNSQNMAGGIFKPRFNGILGYTLNAAAFNDTTCRDLITAEVPFTHRLYLHMKEKGLIKVDDAVPLKKVVAKTVAKTKSN